MGRRVRREAGLGQQEKGCFGSCHRVGRAVTSKYVGTRRKPAIPKCYKEGSFLLKREKGKTSIRHANHKLASDGEWDKSHHPGCPKYRGCVSFNMAVSQGACQKHIQ